MRGQAPDPGRIVETVIVDLPRPSTLEMIRSPALFTCSNQVRDGLFGRTELGHNQPGAAMVESW